MYRKLLSYITTTLLFSQSVAVTLPVTLERACLDRATRTLTLFYTPTADGCSSFVEYIVYGRETAAQPYVELHRHANLTATSASLVLPNTKKWEIYITTKNACNGTDSFNSNHVLIDDTPPGLHNIDSVSVNLYSQKLYAGWAKGAESDIKGYTLFKANPSAGTNAVIKATNGLQDSFLISTFDTKTSNNFVSIAAFDSCDNEGVISNAHSPVYLSHNAMAFNDLCDKKLRLSWTHYSATSWVNDTYDVYAGTTLNDLLLITTIPGSNNTYDFNIPTPGLSYMFYVRAHKQGSTITSSSNLITVNTTGNPKGANNSLGHVTFMRPGETEISILLIPQAGINSLKLYRREKGSSLWTLINTINNPGAYNKYLDRSLDNTNKTYEYKSALTNICDDTFGNSLIHESVLLKNASFVFTWNDYIAWNTSNAFFQRRDRSDAIISETSNNGLMQIEVDPNAWTRYQVIYYHINNGTRIDTAKSNWIDHKVFDTTLVPNVFHPDGSINNQFKISNPNVNLGESVMRIYNRWGQKIFDGDALLGWDGTHNGKDVPHGTYIYTILVNRDDKIDQLKGTIMLLK